MIRVDPPGTQYPIPTDLWHRRAHAPAVLDFATQRTASRAPLTFWDLMRSDEGAARSTFAAMAEEMRDLGAGSRVKVAGAYEEHPERTAAYLDAIAMGESPALRHDLSFTHPNNAESSCGMFIRNLFKLIGVQDPSYEVPYVTGQVIGVERRIADSARLPPDERIPREHGALRYPGDKDASGRLLLPMIGDCVYATKDSDPSDQHFFVVTGFGRQSHGYPVKVERGANPDLWVDGMLLRVAQGGQMYTEEFPDDGADMATNVGHPTIVIQDKLSAGDQSDWVDGDKKVRWWINLHDLVIKKCTFDPDGQSDHTGTPWVMPIRGTRY